MDGKRISQILGIRPNKCSNCNQIQVMCNKSLLHTGCVIQDITNPFEENRHLGRSRHSINYSEIG